MNINNLNNNLNKSVSVYVCVCAGNYLAAILKNGKSYGTGFFGIVPTKL